MILVVLTCAGSLALLTFLLLRGRKDRLDDRLDELSGRGGPDATPDAVAGLARSALPKIGAALLPKSDVERTRLQARLTHAGLYGRQAMAVFLGVKMLLMASPVALGLAAGLVGLVPLLWGLIGGVFLGTVGMIGPSFWLDRRKRRRQTLFRRALPDALDVLVICLEGGSASPARCGASPASCGPPTPSWRPS
jgi:tight adherence protein C